ncbi:MAG: ABC transporter ATP-binding protein [Acidobacteriia bacterium]|nr:ABC transporter ATP-binding protein [Terriglobia bacterium]
MAPLIEVRNLRYRYPDGTPALRGIDFQLSGGETVILLGRNGSGKTTFVLHLNGLLQGEGEIRVCGLSMEKRNLREIRRRIGVVFQEADEQLFMPTVIEDVAYGPLNLGNTPLQARETALCTLKDTGLEGCRDKAPYHLSAGEKRRAALAGVLAMRPDILILDEPTTSLDPPGQTDLVRLLAALPQAKIITTHDTGLARALGGRAVFFEDGKIVAEGGVEELIHRFDWEPHHHWSNSARSTGDR